MACRGLSGLSSFKSFHNVLWVKFIHVHVLCMCLAWKTSEWCGDACKLCLYNTPNRFISPCVQQEQCNNWTPVLSYTAGFVLYSHGDAWRATYIERDLLSKAGVPLVYPKHASQGSMWWDPNAEAQSGARRGLCPSSILGRQGAGAGLYTSNHTSCFSDRFGANTPREPQSIQDHLNEPTSLFPAATHPYDCTVYR